MKKIVYYKAEMEDGYGTSTILLGRFSTYKEAFKRAEGNDGYGGTVDPVKVELIVYDTVEEGSADESGSYYCPHCEEIYDDECSCEEYEENTK